MLNINKTRKTGGRGRPWGEGGGLYPDGLTIGCNFFVSPITGEGLMSGWAYKWQFTVYSHLFIKLGYVI